MVEASDRYWSKRATLEFGQQKVDATLAASEGGRPVVELDNEVPKQTAPENLHDKVKGKTVDGEDVLLKFVNTVTGFDSGSGHKIRSVKDVQEIEIDGIGEKAFVDEEVVVKFDVLCFLPYYPIIHKPNSIPILEREGWEAVGEFADQINSREDYIKKRRHPLRTSTVKLTQEDQNGPPKVQVEKALSRITDILDIASFVLGVGCSPCKIEIEKRDESYTRILTTQRNIGSSFTGNQLVWGSVGDLIDLAFDSYSSNSGNDYKMESVIGFYLDSINVTRTVEGQLSTLFNGIELLAKRYSDYGPQFASTPKRLEHLVSTLDVDVADLARNSKVYPEDFINNDHRSGWREKLLTHLLSRMRRGNRLPTLSDILEQKMIRNEPIPEYFYSKTRQYIVHGDNQSTFDGRYDLLVADLESSKVFMQRLIRNHLFGKLDEDTYPRLGELEPNEFRSFSE